MHVTLASLTVFVEMLVLLTNVAALALLAREYSVRRTMTLLTYGGAFAALAASIAVFFLSHILSAADSDNQFASVAIAAFRSAYSFAAVAGFLLCVARASAAKSIWQRLYATVTFFVTMLALGLLAWSPVTMSQVNGVTIGSTTWQATAAAFAPLLLYALGGLFMSRRSASSIIGIAFFADALLAVSRDDARYVLPALLLLPLFVGFTALEAAAEGHPNAEVRLHPTLLLRSSLQFKSIIATAAVMLAVTFMLLTGVSSRLAEEQSLRTENTIRNDLSYFAKAYESEGLGLQAEVQRAAASSGVIGLLSNDRPSATKPLLPGKNDMRVVRILDTDGNLQYSSMENETDASPLADSIVATSALDGRSQVAWEKSYLHGLWVIRAGAPVLDADGEVIGAAVESLVDRAFIVRNGQVPDAATGYGMVAVGGAQVFSTGGLISADDRTAVLHDGEEGMFDVVVGDKRFLLARVPLLGSGTSGYFYGFVSERDANAMVFRIVAQIAFLLFAAVAVMSAMLGAALGSALRRLAEMRAAASKLGSGRDPGKVMLESPDELGQLAAAFNAATATVGERTGSMETAARERQDFLEHAVRELRTPLNVFRWTLEEMRFGKTGPLTHEQLEMLERLHQTNERLEKMVGNLHDVNMVDRDRVHLQRKPFSMEDVVDDVAGMITITCRTKDIDLRWERPLKPLEKANGDKGYVQKVLHNILQNAVKYTRPHGAISVTVAPSSRSSPEGRSGDYLLVTVADSGIGIPSDERALVFSRFYRAQNVSQFEIEGTGVGLYLAKRFVELHGGEIWLTSQEGAGTTVSFTIPTVAHKDVHST